MIREGVQGEEPSYKERVLGYDIFKEKHMRLPEGMMEAATLVRKGSYGVTILNAKMTEKGSLFLQMEVINDPNAGADAPQGYKNQEGEQITDFIDIDFDAIAVRLGAETYKKIKPMLIKKTASCFIGCGVGEDFEPDDFIGKQAWAVLGGYVNKKTGIEEEQIKSYRKYDVEDEM